MIRSVPLDSAVKLHSARNKKFKCENNIRTHNEQNNILFNKIENIFLNERYEGEEFFDEISFLNKLFSETLMFNFIKNPKAFGIEKLTVLNKTLNFSNDNIHNVEKLLKSLKFIFNDKTKSSGKTKVKKIREMVLNFVSKMEEVYIFFVPEEELFTLPFNNTFVLIDRDDFFIYFNSINQEKMLIGNSMHNLKSNIDENGNFILIEKSELDNLKKIKQNYF